MDENIPWPEIVGKVLVSTTVQATLGSLEMSSRLMIRNFVITQEEADEFINEMRAYIFIGSLWTAGTTFLMYSMHQYLGASLNLLFNLLAMAWIIYRRYPVYVKTATKHGLKIKGIF